MEYKFNIGDTISIPHVSGIIGILKKNRTINFYGLANESNKVDFRSKYCRIVNIKGEKQIIYHESQFIPAKTTLIEKIVL